MINQPTSPSEERWFLILLRVDANTNDDAGLEINVNAGTQSSDDKDADEVPGEGDEGVSKGSGIDDQERTDSSTQDVNISRLSINTANTNINTRSRNINTVVLMIQSTFLYGTIEEEVYVFQPPGFEDPRFPNKVYKVEKALYGLHQAPKAWSTKKFLCNEFEQMMHKRFQMSSMGELTFFLGLQVKQKDDGILISQDKYVADILKKFDFTTVKTASTPMEPNKALIKDAKAEDVPSYTKDFISSCCEENLQILKSQPKLGLWYPRDSPFDLKAFFDIDYARASLDRKSTIGGCKFLGKRLISWQCKKKNIVANSTTEARYAAAANCYGHVL
nr:hypothetical protein [Tanacetum cinerariifolium]